MSDDKKIIMGFDGEPDPRFIMPGVMRIPFKPRERKDGEAKRVFDVIPYGKDVKMTKLGTPTLSMTEYNKRFLEGIASQMGLSYSQVSQAWSDAHDAAELMAPLYRLREQRMPQIEGLIRAGGKRKMKRARRLFFEVHPRRPYSSAYHSLSWSFLCSRISMQKVAKALNRAFDKKFYEIAVGEAYQPGKGPL